MITKEVFQAMQKCWIYDKQLVDAVIGTGSISFFEYSLFSSAIQGNYEMLLSRDEYDKRHIENTFKLIVDALKEVTS
jgi:hypothetical protein